MLISLRCILWFIYTTTVSANLDRKSVVENHRAKSDSTELLEYQKPCPECPVAISLSSLEEVDVNYGNHQSKVLDFLVEDRYIPGQFYFNYGTIIVKLQTDQRVEHFLGRFYEDSEVKYSAGNSTSAEFSKYILDLKQHNETTFYIADYQNNCVRKYDVTEDSVSQYIGLCLYDKVSQELLPGQTYSADFDFLSGVVQIAILEKRGFILMIDTHEYITKYDIRTERVQLLGKDTKLPIQNPRGMLANKEETELYVTESFKYLSKINLDTFEVTLLIGETQSPVSVGMLSSSEIDYAPVLKWMVPDKLIVSVQIVKEAILFVDLEEGQMYSACPNTQNMTVTIPGNISTCELNAPSAFTVSANNSIYVATIVGYDNYYSYYPSDTASALFRMEAKRSLCEFQSATGSELVAPAQAVFSQFQTIQVSCEPGTALNSTFNTLQCMDNSHWNGTIPHCIKITSGKDITDLSPRVGQISGGTLVTATGLVPNFGVKVHLNDSNGVMSPVEFTIEPMRLLFRMPEQNRTGDVEVIINLTENITTRYSFTYKEDPVVNYTILSATILSGGFNMEFIMSNIASSNDYELVIPSNNRSYSCQAYAPKLICNVENFTEIQGEVSPWILPAEIRSDGVSVQHTENITLTVYADPVFEIDKISFDNTKTKLLVIPGKHLDVGPLNSYYEIRVNLKNRDLALSWQCDVTNTLLKCQLPEEDYSEPTRVAVRLGNLEHTINTRLVPKTEPIVKHGASAVPTIISIIAVVVVGVVIVVAVACYRRRLSAAKKFERIRFQSILSKDNAPVTDWYSYIDTDLKSKLEPLLIEPEMLKIKESKSIGEGNFGTIYLGQLFHDKLLTTVAVKTTKDIETSIPMIEKFLEEAVILQDFRHANVLETLGVCIPNTDKPQVILPYMANGDLKSLIQIEHMQFTLGDLMHFAKQIACGMEYLSTNKFVHRDLAARNCLVSEGYIVKIADFGLSKDLYSGEYYKRDDTSSVPLPIRWLALESLRAGKFSAESDVWSFGVVVWELCTRGGQPYSDIDSWDIKPFLEEGRRLERPTFCPPSVWEAVSTCWMESPEDRPTFAMMHEFFSALLEDVEFNPHGAYTYVREYTKSIPNDYLTSKQVSDNKLKSELRKSTTSLEIETAA